MCPHVAVRPALQFSLVTFSHEEADAMDEPEIQDTNTEPGTDETSADAVKPGLDDGGEDDES
jgi:hypothetical protein